MLIFEKLAMSDDEDRRIPCKYGVDCYQKNEAHHKKYKHPKKRSVRDFKNYILANLLIKDR